MTQIYDRKVLDAKWFIFEDIDVFLLFFAAPELSICQSWMKREDRKLTNQPYLLCHSLISTLIRSYAICQSEPNLLNLFFPMLTG